MTTAYLHVPSVVSLTVDRLIYLANPEVEHIAGCWEPPLGRFKDAGNMTRTVEEYAAMELTLVKELMKEKKLVLIPILAQLLVAQVKRRDMAAEFREEQDASDRKRLKMLEANRTDSGELSVNKLDTERKLSVDTDKEIELFKALIKLKNDLVKNFDAVQRASENQEKRIHDLDRELLEAPKKMARNGARAKLDSDPKQKEKLRVRECWEDWQKKPFYEGKSRYKGKAAFALDMLKKYESLESQQVIQNWCLIWEREAQTSHS